MNFISNFNWRPTLSGIALAAAGDGMRTTTQHAQRAGDRRRLGAALRRQDARRVERLQRRLAHHALARGRRLHPAHGDGSDLSGYIVTRKQYENFILDWDWKLSYGGNSGMLYHVVEDPLLQGALRHGARNTSSSTKRAGETNAPTKLEPWQRLGVDYAMHLPDAAKMRLRRANGTTRASSTTTATSSTGSTVRNFSNSDASPTSGSH